MQTAADRILITALCIILGSWGVASIPILDRDEARFAEATRDMRQRGDAVVPFFNGEPHYHKPILVYWLQWGAISLLGPTPAAFRLPSVLCGAALLLALYDLGTLLSGRHAGILAALLAAASPLIFAESRVATADAAMAAAVLWSFVALRKLQTGTYCPWRWSAFLGTFLGLGALAKGPVALLVVGLWMAASGVLGFAMPGGGRGPAAPAPPPCHGRRSLAVPAAIAAAALLITVLPWALLAGLRTDWAFWKEGLGFHFAGRLVRSYEGHRLFPGVHTLLLAVNCLPWSPLIPAAAIAAWRRLRSGDGSARFLLGWAIGPLILFEAASSRLPHYTLPVIPAFALLTAEFLVHRQGLPGGAGASIEPGRRLAPLVAACVIAGGALLLAARPALAFTPNLAALAGTAADHAWIPGLVLAAGGAAALRIRARWGAAASIACALAVWILGLGLLWDGVVGEFPPLRLSGEIVQGIRAAGPGPGDRVLLASKLTREPSLVFQLRRDLFPEAGRVEEVSPEAAARRIAAGPGPAWIVAIEADLEGIRRRMDRPLRIVARIQGFNLSKGTAVDILIGRVE